MYSGIQWGLSWVWQTEIELGSWQTLDLSPGVNGHLFKLAEKYEDVLNAYKNVVQFIRNKIARIYSLPAIKYFINLWDLEQVPDGASHMGRLCSFESCRPN